MPWFCSARDEVLEPSAVVLRVTLAVILAWAALSLVVMATAEPTALRADALPKLPTTAAIPGNVWVVPTASLTNTIVLAHWLGWYGLPTHRQLAPPYVSTDTATLDRQIEAARRMGIHGFVVDWLGPATGLPLANEADRAFIDQATQALFARAQMTSGFRVALMYDYGALFHFPSVSRTQQMSADLAYARTHYLTHSAYLTYHNQPVAFLFPYDSVASDVQLQTATLGLSPTNVQLIYQNPRPEASVIPYVDGFYAWAQPITYNAWRPDGSDWGGGYLDWFYPTMAAPALPYSRMIAVGAVWPGFNDSLAPWRSGPPRFIARRDGQTWLDTWSRVITYRPPLVQIVTWNDWEEGTAIEPGESLGTWARTPIDRMDEVGGWTTLSGANAVSATLAKRAGHDDAAIEMAYALSTATSIDNWVQMKLVSSALDVRSGDLIRFWFRGTPGVTNSLQVGLIERDPAGAILGADLSQVAHVPAWVYTTLSYDRFVPWTTTVTRTSGLLDALFVSVVKFNKTEGITDVGGAGAIAVDGLQVLHSMSRTIPASYETIAGDPTRAMSAANWISRQQQSSGLVLSWQEEPQGKAWLYDQALALIVLSQTDAARAAQLAARLAGLQNADGSWYDGYRPDAISPAARLTDNKWEGSVAWVVYALTRYAAAAGNTVYMTHAISGANWLKTRQTLFSDGRVHTSTEATLDAWWAFRATGLYTEAAQAQRYLLEDAWHADQRRWLRGYNDPVIVLDVQTWGAAFAQAVCQPWRGLAALSFAEYTLSSTSFSGTLRGLDGAGPFSIWNEGTAQYVAAEGRGAQSYLNELRRQQSSDGSMPGSPDDFHGGDVWLTRWHGIAPTAWYYFAETGGPFFVPPDACRIYLPIVKKSQ